MKLTKRIFVSNAWIVLCSLAALWAIGMGLFHLARNGYLFELEELSRVDAHAPAVQLLLEEAGSSPDWARLDSALAPYHYDLLVYDDEGFLYSSVSDGSEALLRMIRRIAWPEEGGIHTLAGITAVGKSSPAGSGVISAVAVHASPAALDLAARWDNSGGRLLLAGGMLLFSLAVLGLISLFFPRRLARSIAEPVDQLLQGSRRVQEGDLSLPIRYRGLREFELVCDSFNGMQRHLLEEQEKNARYERARTDMVAGISHDLRTPLTSVKGYVKGVLDGVAATPEKQRQYLSVAYQSACDMDALLQQLFYFSRLETGSLPLVPADADLAEYAAGYIDSIQEPLNLQGVSIRLETDSRPHPVRLDREQMDRVLANLVGNAVKYAGVSPLQLRLTVGSAPDGREYLQFRDNGRGVPPEQLPHLFEQFYRGDEARTAQGDQGSGLGLYIAKHIIQAHGGEISAENDGSLLLTIHLPGRN